MDVIDYRAPKKLLGVARGHPYKRDAFAGLWSKLEGFDACLVEQPLAASLMGEDLAADYDALLCYDMPGVDFGKGGAAALPPEGFCDAYLAMLDAGIGVVYLHHSLAAWPSWDEYARIIGGRFHYQPARLAGDEYPDSGYRHRVRHRLAVMSEHPVTAGLPAEFEMTDELYLCPIFSEDITPLLRSDYHFDSENFFSAANAVAGDLNSREGWSHPTGSNIVAWAKSWGNSPLVYIQGGDDAKALRDPNFRRLVQNALRWVSSDEARAWAGQQ
ncbi:MAG: ThuA domain-containing protein [Pseudomonadota bacterium]